MAKTVNRLSTKTEEYLVQMGAQVRSARVRRSLTAEELAEKADISLSTVWAIEKGSPSVSLGKLASVLHVLDLDSDLALLAKDEKRKQDDEKHLLPKRVRHPKKKPAKAKVKVQAKRTKTPLGTP